MKNVVVLQHVRHENLGALAQSFERVGVAWQNVQLLQCAPDNIDFAQAIALVVLGGPMNVDQLNEYPYLEREVEWIQAALARELPVLGICLGSQLLAKALGAKVYPNRTKEIGWYKIDLTPEAAEDRLLGGYGRRQTVFQWHGDTFDLPSGTVQLARSSLCEQQAYRYGENAYGLQFHVEVTPEMVYDWLDESNNRSELAMLDYVDPDAIRAATPAAIARMQDFGEEVVSRFAAMCRPGM